MKYYFEDFKKNKSKIIGKINDVGDTIITTKTLYVLFPERYMTAGIATITDKVKVLGIVCVMDDNLNYYNIVVPNYLTMEPTSIEDVTVNDIVYKRLTFEAGAKLLTTKKVLKDTEFGMIILRDFIIKGNMPIFLGYTELLGLNEYDITMSVLLSIVARVPNEKTYIRNSDYDGHISWIGLNNIHYLNNTMSKITGSYLSKGLVSAITDPEKEGIVHNDVLLV